MSVGEAHRLALELMGDPASHVGAAMAGWDHPLSREGIAILDLWDLLLWSHPRKGNPKPHPRPYKERTTTRAKPATTLTQDEIVEALRGAGHAGPLPMTTAGR